MQFRPWAICLYVSASTEVDGTVTLSVLKMKPVKHLLSAILLKHGEHIRQEVLKRSSALIGDDSFPFFFLSFFILFYFFIFHFFFFYFI